MEVLENRSAGTKRYEEHVNPHWARLLEVLEMNVRYVRCAGSELFDETGRRYLDFLSGYCVHNAGHNHPAIVQALKCELDRQGPAILQSHVAELAGELGARLCALAGGRLEKVFFCSSGCEGVEAAIKFARAYTGRGGMICASGAFHGLTCGALSLMDGAFWRDGFGPLLEDVTTVPFGDLTALETHLRLRRAAAFIVEPVQAEAGICLPPAGYLQEAQRLCRKYGSLFVLDEVQTGMFRTGAFLAAHRYGVDPDIVILAKALSGGLIPCGAVRMSNAVYDSVYGSLKRSLVHTSTFSENNLAMRAGIATLDVLEREELGKCAERVGDCFAQPAARNTCWLRNDPRHPRGWSFERNCFSRPAQTEHSRGVRIVRGVSSRGVRAACGNATVPRPRNSHADLWQQLSVLKAAPPLSISEAQLEEFVRAVRPVVELIHSSASFWTDALGLARRAVNI